MYRSSGNSTCQDWGLLIGRIFYSVIFVLAGSSKIMTFTDTAALMASKGLPMTDVLLVISILFELGGGLMVLLGWHARIGAMMLFIFILPVTVVFHTFWGLEGAEMANQMAHFFKNFALMGGAIFLMYTGAGRFGINR